MAGFSNTPFLQALGWAVINNIWQMAFLWLCYLVLQHAAPLSSFKKYIFLVGGVFLGFGWFLVSFFSYLLNPAPHPFLASFSVSDAGSFVPLFLSSASMAYLALLMFPAARLGVSWLFIKKIKVLQLQKSSWSNRLFVESTRLRLGIKKKVPVYCSTLINSPITVGFIKPVILLPFSICNHLSTQQTEAILLHELAHIRRSDYVINLLLSVVRVVLYFNPFLNLFLKRIEQERETCCDETVLQFGYDKISYASALLELERRSFKVELAMAASNKNNLLRRIETIVGIKQSARSRPAQLIPALCGLLLLFVTNSLHQKQAPNPSLLAAENASPLQSFAYHMFNPEAEKPIKKGIKTNTEAIFVSGKKSAATDAQTTSETAVVSTPPTISPTNFNTRNNADYVNVAYDAADENLTEAEKQQVKETVETTKKVLALQWKEVDKSIGDAMSDTEKQLAKTAYLNKVADADWRKLENSLKRGYEEIDWNSVTLSLNEVITSAKLDSIEVVYTKMLAHIEKVQANSEQLVLPDVSEQQILGLKTHLQDALKQIKTLRTKKIIRL